MPRRSAPPLAMQSLGFQVWVGRPDRMGQAHRHHEVELNYLLEGRMTYLLGGRVLDLSARCLGAFWAAIPHQLVQADRGSRCGWVTLPLAWVLRWRLPETFVSSLLAGRLLLEPPSAEEAALDAARFPRWQRDLQNHDSEMIKIVALEVEARLRRLALTATEPVESPSRTRTPANLSSMDQVQAMARYIAEHYPEPVRVAAIARQVGLHPNYAMTLFRKTCGMSLIDYLTRQRVCHAQRLLLSTDLNIMQVAWDSGFGSLSRFYEAFHQFCGQTPRSFRKSTSQE